MPEEWQGILDWADKHASLLDFLLALLVALVAFIAYLSHNWLSRLWRKTAPDLPKERQALLNNVKTRIDQWFQDGLSKQIEIPLRYTAAPEAVNQYWLSRVYTGPVEQIPEKADIGDLYRSSNGQFLLLGEPGTGKSNELHNLLHALHATAAKPNANQPVPILVNLTSWAVDQYASLEDWIAKELQDSYEVRGHRSRDWANRVVPLLDGLDEVSEDVRNACLETIVRYAKPPVGGDPGKPVVVASRREEYDRLVKRVKMSAAQVRRLDADELDALLCDPKLTDLRAAVAVDDADPAQSRKLREVLDTPLMLALLYEAGQAEPSLARDPAQRVYERFFETAVRGLADFSAEPAKRWLGWLAAVLEHRKSVRFDLEEVCPEWLDGQIDGPTNRLFRKVSGGLAALPYAVTYGTGTALFLGSGQGLMGGMLTGLVFGVFFSIVFTANDFRQSTEMLRLTWQSVFAAIIAGAAVAMPVGFVCGLTARLVGTPSGGLVYGLAGAAATWIVTTLHAAFEEIQISERQKPGLGINRSLWHGMLFAMPMIVLGVGFATLEPLLHQSFRAFGSQGRGVALKLSAVPPVLAALAVTLGFYKGIGFALGHYVTRFVLWRSNLAPWRYVAFLTQAADKGILKPVGGGFQFRHRELRRFIAERYGAEWLQRPSQQSEIP